MKEQRNKKKYNIIMIALIFIMVSAGIMGVGTMKGWFGDSAKNEISEEATAGEASNAGTETADLNGENQNPETESKDASQGDKSKASATTGGSKAKSCTIQIQCKSILNNMDDLKEGKNKYVPSNGVILATSRIEFNEGETAYDVTKRACSAAGIQIEAAYTPAYGSYYVEGMNHLYEFDCGEMSGWMYKVNGWAPNYGSSEYQLKDGDSIVWYYTCTGR